jgi:hypothetical protein
LPSLRSAILQTLETAFGVANLYFYRTMPVVVQQAISELDFDFVAYADEHFERMLRTASEPRFQEALA